MTNASVDSKEQKDGTRIPTVKAMNLISLPTRDFAQSKRFFTEVLGGELQEDGPTAKIQFTNFAIALGAQDGGATAPHREHPTMPSPFRGNVRYGKRRMSFRRSHP